MANQIAVYVDQIDVGRVRVATPNDTLDMTWQEAVQLIAVISQAILAAKNSLPGAYHRELWLEGSLPQKLEGVQ